MLIMIEIKDKNGELKLSTVIGDGSIRCCTLMKEDYVTLVFSTDEPVYFKLGDGIDNEWGMFELVDLYSPTYNESTGGYDYQLRLDAYYWKWKNKIFKYTPENHGQEASWSLTATLDVHLGVFLRNLQALGYKYRNTPFSFEIGNTVENTSQLITYENTNLIDALNMMAETWDCEWWVTDSVIHFGKCEYGDPVKLELGVEVETMTREGNNQKFATRIYAFGSTNNIPSDYRPVDESVVVNGVVQKRLMLPEGTPYLDAYENMTQEEAVEDVVIFDDVYPRRIGTLSDITTQEYTDTIENEDGTTTEEKWLAYRFKDAGINFSKEYILPGQELQITFQSGKLNGLTFGVIFNPILEGEEEKPEKLPDGSWNPEAQLWEIVRNEDYGRPLPGGELIPANGDTYYLTGFNIKLVSDQYIPAAEEELKEKAQKYLDKTKTDPNTYNCTLRPDYVYNKDMEEEVVLRTFELGDKINLVNPTFFSNGRVSRVIGYERKLDIPYDHPVYFVGEVASTSRIGELEDKVDALTYKGQTFTGNGSGVYVVGRYDSTPLSDRNVLSSLKAISTFLRKDMADSTPYLLRLLAGSYFGKYIEGQTGGKIDANGIAEFLNIILRGDLKSINFSTGALGSGYALQIDENGDSLLEVDRLLVRKIAYFVELVIQRMSHVGGQIVLTPASMKCVNVEEYDDYYRCYFESTDGDKEITNDFVVGDQARCQTFNIKAGTNQNVSNSYYWRLVVGVGDDYIDLSKTDCDAGSTVPQADDEIVLLGNRTDATRQAAIVLASYGNDAPYIKLYRGINSYQLSGKEFISFSRTQIKMIADELYFSTGESVSTVINGVKSDLEETKTEFQGKIDTVDSKVEGIQIGVRNLASKTKITNNAGATINGYEYTFPAQNTDGLSLNKDIFELNEEYVLSFRMHVNSGTLVNIGGHQNGFSVNNIEINGTKPGGTWNGGIEGGLDTENLIIAHVRKTSDEGNIGLWIQPNRMAGTLVNVTISEISVVKGNKYVGWSPAPEDIQKEVDAANAAAQDAKTAADNAQLDATNAINDLDKINSDNYVSPTEKTSLRQQQADIQSEYQEIISNAERYGVSTTSYASAYTAANNALVKYTAVEPTYIPVGSDYGNIAAYYEARQAVLDNIATEAKKIADEANSRLDNLQVGGRNLIRNSKEQTLAGASNYAYKRFTPTVHIKPNTDYVFSVDKTELTKGNASQFSIVFADVSGSSAVILSDYTKVPISDERQSVVIRANDKVTSGDKTQLLIYSGLWGAANGNTLVWHNIKLEEGNMATDWSPAPEDLEAAAQEAKDLADAAQAAADAADAKADSAKEAADAAKDRLDDWAADSVISPTEKQGLKDETARIDGDKSEITANYTKYGLGTPTAYNSAHSAYRAVLVTLSASTPETIAIPSDFATKQTAYYTARTNALTAIAEKAKQVADAAQTAAENAQTAADNALDKYNNLKIGMKNLVSFKHMLSWNDKAPNKNIAVWGKDIDGVYLGIHQKLLFDNVVGHTETNPKDIFLGDGNYKENTQYVLSVKWKLAGALPAQGWNINIDYTDGSRKIFRIEGNQTTLVRKDEITAKGKTIQKIWSNYGYSDYRTLVYALSLVEGNVIPLEIPTAEEDIWRSEVNLVDGGKEGTITAGATNNYVYKTYIVPVLKPNTVYTVKVEDIEVLAGSPDTFQISLYDTGYDTEYDGVHLTLAEKSGLLITPTGFTAGKAYLLTYAGRAGSTAGNSVRYTGISLVEGFYPPTMWLPSNGDINNEIQDVSNALTSLGDEINGAFKDGIINEAETKAIGANINVLNAEKKDIDAQYTELYGNTYLTGTAKTNLQSAKTAYNTAHTNLINAINTAISDGIATATEKTDIDNKFTAYGTALGTYRTRAEEANKAIQDEIKRQADEAAQEKVDAIQVGVRNLLLKSNVELGDNYYQFGRYYFHTNDKYALKKGKIYTLVLCYTLGENNTHIDAYWRGGTGSPMSHHFQTRGDRVIESFTQEFNGDDTANTYLPFYQFPDGTYGSKVHWAVLVEGNKAPNMWVAAPEDIQAEVEAAQQAASDAQEAATAAQSDATEAKTELSQINSDSVISPVEKTALKQQQADIQAEYNEIIADAGRYSISTTAYKNAYTSANNALTKYTATSPTYITVGSDYANIAAYYDARQTILNSIAAAAKKASDDAMQAAEDEAELAKWRAIGYSWNSGKPLWTDDPTFKEGTNGFGVYDNAGSGSVKFTHEAKQSDSPVSDSEYNLKIVCSGGGTPNNGGFLRQVMTRANAVFVFRFIAKLPEGTGFDFNYNSYGAEGTYRWVTSNRGTGRFEEYICVAKCGATGSFSTIGYFSFWGTAPVTCYLAYAGAFDVTAGVSTGEQLQTVSGTVTTLSSELTNTKEALESYKDEVEVKFTSAATATEEQIENAVVNLQKGMRNLLLQSTDIDNNGYLLGNRKYSKPLTAGKKYTLVICYTLGANNSYIGVYQNTGNYQVKNFSAKGNQVVEKYAYTAYSGVADASYMGFYQSPNGTYGSIVHWACLYEGDITDTAPDYFVNAPEDLNLEINSVKQSVSAIEQTAENISLRVTTTETKVNETLPQEIEDALTDAKDYTDGRTKPMWKGWIDATGLDEDKYYPVTITIPSNRKTTIEVYQSLDYNCKPLWSTHNGGFSLKCIWEVIGSGWGINPNLGRQVLDYSKGFTAEETVTIDGESVMRAVHPVGTISQIGQANMEYIYVRGGGQYYFTVTNANESTVPVLRTSDYTWTSGSTSVTLKVLTSAEITPIEITGVTKTELKSEIEVLEDAINLRVTKTDYDANNVALNQQIGQLETSYNSINGTVSSLNTRLGVLEESGFIVQDDFVTLFSQQLSESGAEIASAINITPNGITLQSEKVEFVSNDGAMKFFGKDLYEPLNVDFDGFAGVDIDIDAIAGGSTEVINVNNVFKVSSRGDFFFGVKNGNYIEYYAGGRLQNSAGVGSDIPAQFIINVDTLNIRGGSINFNNGVFKVDSNGAMTATEANITGTVDATYLNATQGGIIGGFTISENYLTGSKFRLSGGQLRFLYDGHEVYLGGHPIQAPSSGGTGVILGSFVTDGGSESFGLNDDIALYAAAKVDRDVNFALWTNGYVRMQNLIGGTTDGVASTYRRVGMIMADTGQNSAGWCMLRVYRG